MAKSEAVAPPPFFRRLTAALDRLYLMSGYLAALSLVALLVIVVAQMVARWNRSMLPGAIDYAGYLMATASFLAFAYGLGQGAHIRVNLLLGALGKHRIWCEIWALGVASVTGVYFAYYAVRGTYWSYLLHDISQGQDATPLWIPQIPMAVGSCIFALALVDHFLRTLITRRPSIVTTALE